MHSKEGGAQKSASAAQGAELNDMSLPRKWKEGVTARLLREWCACFYPCHLDYSLCFIQPGISHDVLRM